MSAKPFEILEQSKEGTAAYMYAFGYRPWFKRTFGIVDFINRKTGNIISVDSAEDPINLKISAENFSHDDIQKILKEDLEATSVAIPFTMLLAQRAEKSASSYSPFA